MHAHAAPLSSAGFSRRRLATLGFLALLLGAAFVYAPRILVPGAPGGGAAEQRDIVGAVRSRFIEYWDAGRAG